MSKEPEKIVLIYSGGLDSTVLLYDLRSKGIDVLPLGINYGQRHAKELMSAQKVCNQLGIKYHVADLSSIRPLIEGSSQTDPAVPVPEGHYAEESMKLTVVPNRNMIMLSIAAGYAISKKAESVAYAAHSGDHAIYPDCRHEFADALDIAIKLADWHPVSLLRPYIDFSKADIVKIGHNLGVPFVDTWSCYKGGDIHCGKCGTCVERKEAFHLAGIIDPTEYANISESLAI